MFPVRSAGRRRASVVVTAAGAVAIAALAAACSSASHSSAASSASHSAASGRMAVSTSQPTVAALSAASVGPARAGAAKLNGAAATALVNKAVANTRALTSVQVSGQAVMRMGSGKKGAAQPATFDLTLIKNAGCVGTVGMSKTEAFRVVKAGNSLWVLPDSSFYSNMHLSSAVRAEVAGKYLKLQPNDPKAAGLTAFCTLNGMLSQVSKTSGKHITAVPVTYDGAAAYKVTEAGQRMTAYISNRAKPVLLRVADPKSATRTLVFTHDNAVKTIITPAAAESVAGSKAGM